jgi:hypothetical protein
MSKDAIQGLLRGPAAVDWGASGDETCPGIIQVELLSQH